MSKHELMAKKNKDKQEKRQMGSWLKKSFLQGSQQQICKLALHQNKFTDATI